MTCVNTLEKLTRAVWKAQVGRLVAGAQLATGDEAGSIETLKNACKDIEGVPPQLIGRSLDVIGFGDGKGNYHE